MRFFQCTVRKPNNAGKAILAVVAIDETDAAEYVRSEYGSHLLISNIVPSGVRAVQIGGDLVAVSAK